MIALLGLLPLALAQDAERFHPYGDFYGLGHTQSGTTLGHLQLGVGLWGSYADDPVVLVDASGNRVAPAGTANEDGDGLVDGRMTTLVQVGLGLTKWGSLSVDVPVTLINDTWALDTLDVGTPESINGASIGDVRVQPKVSILGAKFPVQVAIAVPVGLPTAPAGNFYGAGGVTATPKLIVEYAAGNVRANDYAWRVAANAGYAVRPESRVRDVMIGGAFDYSVGVGVHPAKVVEAVVELHGQVGGSAAASPAEALVGARFLFGRAVALQVGGGTGVGPGVGSPDYRVYAGFQIAPSFDPASADKDDDGAVDAEDRCPELAEDKDGYEDDDGCPDLDNDADGREDRLDQCPDDPEDDDGFLDNDGCPEVDNDKDGVPDVSDRCPDQAETLNGVADEDGCPDDKPVDDTDQDGFKDDVDRCPFDPEDLNGFEDEDGCPDERLKNARVVVTQGSIKINDVIYFDTGRSTIQERSNSLLDEIAQVMTSRPELKRVRVEGHTDDVGNDMSNLRLSQERAEAVVRYLVSRGVAAQRLDAAGFGEMRPIAPNNLEDGRAQNRRVEFIIVDRE